MSIVIICRVSCSSNVCVCVCVCVCYILPTSRLIVNLKRIVRRVESLLHLIPPSLRTPRCQREKLPLRNRHRRQRVPLVTLRLRNELKRIIQMTVLICSFLRAQQLPQRPAPTTLASPASPRLLARCQYPSTILSQSGKYLTK